MRNILLVLFFISIFCFSCTKGSTPVNKTGDQTIKSESEIDADVTLTDADLIVADTILSENEKETAPDTSAVTAESVTATLQLDKTLYRPDEEMTVTFTASPELAHSGWIGVIPADVPHGSHEKNDSNDIDFDFLGQQTSGTIMFLAPFYPGKYDLRLDDPDSGREAASVSFEVR